MGTTSSKFLEIAPMFTYAMGILDVTILTAWLNGMFDPSFLVYAGTIIALIVELCTAAYLAVKTVDATVSFNNGFAFNYRITTWFGNLLGLWECMAYLMFMGWSMVVIVAAFYMAMYYVDMTEAREIAAYKDGKFGTAVNFTDGIKFFVLLMIQAMAVLIAGDNLGLHADKRIDYFDDYDNDTKTDGTSKRTGEKYMETFAAYFDLGYHAMTLMYSWVVFTWIAVGGFLFSWMYAVFHPVSETCDLSDVDSSKYDGIESDVMGISKGTYDECKATIAKVFKAIDLNNDGYLDRCEDAKFLSVINKNEDYARKYSGDASLQSLYKVCDYYVLDAFEREDDTDYYWLQNLLSRLAGVFPFNVLFFSEDRPVVYWLSEDKDGHDHL